MPRTFAVYTLCASTHVLVDVLFGSAGDGLCGVAGIREVFIGIGVGPPISVPAMGWEQNSES
jgi:hypothetical protein